MTKEGLNKKLEEKTEEYSQPNYTMMFIFFAIGCLFMLAAVTALPFVVFAPAGFNMYMSLSSFCMIVAVSFYHGPCVYLKKLFCDRTMLPISLLYIGSTVGSLYCSLFASIGYFYTLGLIAVQCLAVSFFVLQAWTGGDNA